MNTSCSSIYNNGNESRIFSMFVKGQEMETCISFSLFLKPIGNNRKEEANYTLKISRLSKIWKENSRQVG